MPNLSSSSFPASSHFGRVAKLSLVIAVAVVAIGGGVFAWQLNASAQAQQAKTTAHAFITDLTNGDTTSAYTLTSLSVQKNSTQDQFATSFTGLTSTKAAYTSEVVKVSDKTANYEAILDGFPATKSGSTKASYALKLVKVGTTWQVDSIDVE